WAQQPAVKNGEFNGTLSMSCEVEGLSGGGLTELQKHFEAQLKDSAAEIHGGPYVRTSAGYPSQAYDVSLELEAGNERTRMRGETVIATDGVTGLVSNFRSTQPPRSGNAAYLKHVEDSVKVTSTLRRG